MHEKQWLVNTAYWKRGNTREPQNFTVISPFDYTLGMLDAKKSVKHGFDKNIMTNLVDNLCDSFGYDQEIMSEGMNVKRMGPRDRDEMNYKVQSYSERDLQHIVTLRTIPYEWENMDTRFEALKNMTFTDHCLKGSHKGRLCSMPEEACLEWNINKNEWEKRQYTSGNSKIYGEVADKHVIGTIMSLDLFPVFDERRFQELLPEVVYRINTTSKRKKRGKKWYAEDLDESLYPIVEKMGLPMMTEMFRLGQIKNTFKDVFYTRIKSYPETNYYK